MVEQNREECDQVNRLPDAYFTQHNGEKHVAIKARLLSGNEAEFLFFRNNGWDLNKDKDRKTAAEDIARLKVHLGINAALGPQINLQKALESGNIEVSCPKPEWPFFTTALYIEHSQHGSVLPDVLAYIPDALELRNKNRQTFEKAYNKAVASLPDNLESQ